MLTNDNEYTSVGGLVSHSFPCLFPLILLHVLFSLHLILLTIIILALFLYFLSQIFTTASSSSSSLNFLFNTTLSYPCFSFPFYFSLFFYYSSIQPVSFLFLLLYIFICIPPTPFFPTPSPVFSLHPSSAFHSHCLLCFPPPPSSASSSPFPFLLHAGK